MIKKDKKRLKTTEKEKILQEIYEETARYLDYEPIKCEFCKLTKKQKNINPKKI